MIIFESFLSSRAFNRGLELNLLTEIPLRHYSDGMNPEFHLLSEKINQLAALAQSLRRENAELRLGSATLTAKNDDLSKRMAGAALAIPASVQVPSSICRFLAWYHGIKAKITNTNKANPHEFERNNAVDANLKPASKSGVRPDVTAKRSANFKLG